MKRRWVSIIQALTIPVAVLLLWLVAAQRDWLAGGLLPSPSEVWAALTHLARRGLLVRHLQTSVLRVLFGFSWAAAMAVPAGVVLGWVRPLRPWLLPSLHFLRQIPPVAWIPMFLLWFGIGEASKHAVIVYAAFFPIFLNTVVGVEQIPRSLWEVSRVLEFSPGKTLIKLVLPGSAVAILSGLRLGLGMSWRALVAAEMLAATSGLGYLVMSARSLVRTDEMVVGMILIGVVGLMMEQLLALVERALLPWNRATAGRGGGSDGSIVGYPKRS